MKGVLVVLAVALALLGLGYVDWLRNDAREGILQAERGPAGTPPRAARLADATVIVDTGGPATIGYGLSFALAQQPAALPTVVQLHCHGEPAPLDRPHSGSCNPYRGDTSCRRVLPIACVKPTGVRAPENLQQDFYNGWTNGQLGATDPVMGATLTSEKFASARCEAELGPGWRMAEFHDGGGGWGLQGERAPGIKPATRYWVHINDQAGNCWNSPS